MGRKRNIKPTVLRGFYPALHLLATVLASKIFSNNSHGQRFNGGKRTKSARNPVRPVLTNFLLPQLQWNRESTATSPATSNPETPSNSSMSNFNALHQHRDNFDTDPAYVSALRKWLHTSPLQQQKCNLSEILDFNRLNDPAKTQSNHRKRLQQLMNALTVNVVLAHPWST